MQQKDLVNAYLVSNFDKIQKARLLNGFSWKPILEELVGQHPNIGLDPNSPGNRDRVRNAFLNLRKKSSNIGEPALLRTPMYPPVLDRKPALEFSEKPSFIPLDTYNKTLKTPETETEEFLQWKAEKTRIKNQQGMHIVIGCMHLPAVNKPFFNAFIKLLTDARGHLKGLHLIGDILDCKSLSHHDSGRIIDITLEEEYAEANKYLDVIDSCLDSNVEKNYLWGNHEQWYERLIKKVDMSKFGGALLSPTKGCKFIERGYTVQEDYLNAKIQLGKYLDLVHGQYITQNSAKKHLDVYKKSIMFAHTHKMGVFYDCDKAAFNIGWMGDSSNSAFNYASAITKSQWQNGFAIVNIDEQGYYHTQLVQWYNNRFVFGTMEYR